MRDNIIIEGIGELERETWVDTDHLVRKFFYEELKFSEEDSRKIGIGITHHKGQEKERYERKIVVKFNPSYEQNHVMQANRRATNLHSRECK